MAKGYVYDLKKEGAAEWNVARFIPERSRHFEVAIDPDLAAQFREGRLNNVREALLSEDIFTDTKKGLRPSEQELTDFFGTTDKVKIAEIIIKKGIIQYSDKYRDEQREKKRKRLLELVRVNCVDGKTGHPLPVQRIANAFEEARIKVKEGKTAEEQLEETVKELKPVLPIRVDSKVFSVLLPLKTASRAQGILKQFGTINKEEWKTDGSYSCLIEVPAGRRDEFFDRINELTHGEALIEEKENR